jgi:hypothetical protein
MKTYIDYTYFVLNITSLKFIVAKKNIDAEEIFIRVIHSNDYI